MADGDSIGDVAQRRTVASIVMAALILFLIYALLPYVNAFFGALILYVIFSPLHSWLSKGERMRSEFAAVLVILVSMLVITIPLMYAAVLMVSQVNIVLSNADNFTEKMSMMGGLIPGSQIRSLLDNQFAQLGTYIQQRFLSIVEGVAQTVTTLTIMYFLLYYMLVNYNKMPDIVKSVIPFNDKNTRRLSKEFSDITNSTIISTGVIAVIQGALIAFCFWIFDVPGEIFWGFIAVIFAVLPVVGTPLLWFPAGVLKMLGGNYTAGIGILIFGTMLVNFENMLRPYIQKKVGQIHPLISIVGFFMGLNYFGILGIIVGPLLLSYFFLMVGMFKEEYLDGAEFAKKQEKAGSGA